MFSIESLNKNLELESPFKTKTLDGRKLEGFFCVCVCGGGGDPLK
jgi:hypothetical protein